MKEPIQDNCDIVVPAQVLLHPAINPATFYTWMLLCILVGRDGESAPVTIPELEAYTGKSRSALYAHLTALRRAEFLLWRFAARGQLILSFPAGQSSENLDQKNGLLSRKLEQASSSRPENCHGEQGAVGADSSIVSQSEKLDQGTRLESRNLDNDPSNSPEIWIETGEQPEISPQTRLESKNLDGKPPLSPENWNHALSLKPLIKYITLNQEEVLREARFQKTGLQSENLERAAVRAYRSTLGLRPNKTQRTQIGAQVCDLELWQVTLEHWGAHRWNPKNIPGILELYGRDGPPGCRFCRQDNAESGLDALASLRREYAGGERG